MIEDAIKLIDDSFSSEINNHHSKIETLILEETNLDYIINFKEKNNNYLDLKEEKEKLFDELVTKYDTKKKFEKEKKIFLQSENYLEFDEKNEINEKIDEKNEFDDNSYEIIDYN
jgi:hypothetical protein